MNENKLTRRNWNLLAICGILLLISIIYLSRNYRKAFPAYDLKFDITRAESRDLAEKFLSCQHIELNGYRHAVVFDYDELPKTFIEKEVGFEKATRLLCQDFPIWHWSNRWFKPLSQEEIKVSLALNGRVTYFEHFLPEEAAAERISVEGARQICHDFLVKTMQLNLDDWEFVEDKTDIKPNRVDHFFTYQKKGFEISNATYRLEIGVLGDQVGKYHEYWKLPEQWLRDYKHLRSLNSTTALAADVLFLLILIAALIVFIVQLNRKNVHLKTALWFGLITFILQFAGQINELPITIYAFDTNQSFGNYYGNYFIQTFVIALLYALLVIVITGAGEALYRRAYPHHLSMSKIFSPAGLRTKSFLINSILGMTLAVVFIGFQTGFYIIANHFGAWAPVEVNYSDAINTYFPWIFVLLMGFIPAVTEEFSFRLFAIPFFSKIFRSKPLAILIPALIWGFAHANYPNQPFWIRGAEVSLFGIFVGVLFLRYGILTVLVWHYTVDAIYTAVFLVKTGQPYLIVTAILAAGVIVLPILYNIFCYRRNRSFADSSGLLNSEMAFTTKPKTATSDEIPKFSEIVEYRSYSPHKILTGLILSAIFLVILLIPDHQVGDFYRYPISKNEIKHAAQEFLAEKEIDSGNFRIAMGLNNNYDPLMGQYVIQHSSLNQLDSIMTQYLPDLIAWQVRFFQPGQREEYRVYIDPMKNTVVAFSHILDETASGARLSKASAQRKTEEFLSLKKYDLSNFSLIESNADVLPNRTDYHFIWESRGEHPASVADARLRLIVTIKGDEIAAFATDYKIPEDWLLAQTRRTTLQSIMTGVQIALIILILYRMIKFLLKRPKKVFSGWRTTIRFALCLAGLAIIVSGLNHSAALLNYDTSWTLTNWTFLWILSIFLKAVGIGLLTVLIFATVGLLYPDAIQTLQKPHRPQYTRDALIASILIICGLLACNRLSNYIVLMIKPELLASHQITSGLEESLFPFFDALQRIIIMSLLSAAIIAFIGFILQNLIGRNFRQVITLIILTAVFLPDNYLTFSGYFAVYVQFLLPILWLYFCLKYFVGANPPAYLYSAVGYFMVDQISSLLRTGSPQSRMAAILLILLGLVLILWLIIEKRVVNSNSKIIN
ncbi:MAG TPA: type II CAAX endopeptidase family protein [Candidatus Marinimicrobia bacterium]|nr:type II CAAX endopeptidase family protein [Candidatus Neomarinimicrobiota bacterium]HRS52365.1 type II CAAX endopeptidase family protein [Candidatus Neomarinimicrobiota bacterium]HRU92986.1 type II CAAX endopeptidase family protein [Candidatus Neomarinimicrobiota bacterium]